MNRDITGIYLTLNLGAILRAMDPFKELSFFGRFSSMVRRPYKLLKRTSSGSSSGSSDGIFAVAVVLAIYIRFYQYKDSDFMWAWRMLYG